MEEKFRLTFEGEAQDLVKQIDDVTKKLNKTRELTTKWNKERSQLAREERREAFNSLSIEERRVRLTKQQLDLERHLARARSQGNTLRATALGVSLARNRSAMRGLGSSDSSSAADGFLGGMIASRLGPLAIAGAVTSAARSALRFADETSDLADQMGITREQVVQIMRAAGAAGVNVRQVIGGLSSLSAARSSALGGDIKAQDLFKRYNANPGEENILELAKSISGSLGASGMGAKDRGAMGQLFGRRPEGVLAALRAIESISNIEDDIAKVDAANAKIESFWNKVKEGMVRTAAAVISAGEYAMKVDRQTTGTLAGRGGIGMGTFQPEVKGSVGGLGFGSKRRAEDTVLNTAAVSNKTPLTVPQIMGSIPQADSLARMGLYIGGGPNSPSVIMRQQLSELKAIKEVAKSQTAALKSAL